MAAERSRASYRAIYLAAPLKFHTTLHAFTRTVPQFHIDSWQKDPRAFEKHKWRVAKEGVQGRWTYRHGPLAGSQLEDWPEPGLLGANDLVRVAARAQAEQLKDRGFWEQVAERTVKFRDTISVTDLTVILDALVTANHRHTFLMKTLTRELIDDVDKLSLVEAAIVANAYAHFRCVSKPLLSALGDHVVQALTGHEPRFINAGGTLDSDPGSLAVLLQAFVTLGHVPKELLEAFGLAMQQHAEALTFPDVVNLVESFVKVKHDFKGDAEFWAVVTSKVRGQRMAVLCPALRAAAKLNLDEPALREALVEAITQGLANARLGDEPHALGTPLPPGEAAEASVLPSLPAFMQPEVPAGLRGLLDPARDADGTSVYPAELPMEDVSSMIEAEIVAADPIEEEEEPAPSKRTRPAVPRWYNAVARQPWLPASPQFTGFDASRNFDRNRRGLRVAEALEGLNLFWQASPSGSTPSESEVTMLAAAGPVLRSSLPGVLPGQLVACAELCAKQPGTEDIVQDIVREAVRRLSNFETSELRRLWVAAKAAGVQDPYLERARRRRFPKALRRELRHQEAGASPSEDGTTPRAAPAAAPEPKPAAAAE